MKVILMSIEDSPSLFLPVLQKMLIQNGHECKYVHIPLRKTDEMGKKEIENIVSELRKFCGGAGIIGISCMTNSFLEFTRIAKKIKEFRIPVVIGGVHPTMRPEECLEYADYVCVGEGEIAILELIKKLENKKKTDNINNIYVKKNGKLIRNKFNKVIKNLDSLPIPNFDFNNLFFYYDRKIRCLNEEKKLIKRYYTKYYYIITSRGCPYRCKYCLNEAIININHDFVVIRRRSEEHVIQELKNVKKILQKDIIIGFVDDDFCARSNDELKRFCEIYKKEIGLSFFCASTPTSINEEKIKTLIDAGLIRLEIGIQSINDKVNREIYGRYVPSNVVIKTVKILEKYRHKVAICYDFILDNPWETDETRIESLNFIMSMKKPINILLFSLTLYPGTGLYDRAKKEELIKEDYSQIYRKNHMLLENGWVNTLFVLHTKYRFPRWIIRMLIKFGENNKVVRKILKNNTYYLWRVYNYFYGLRDSIKRKDKEQIIYYLKAPFKKILSILKNEQRQNFLIGNEY